MTRAFISIDFKEAEIKEKIILIQEQLQATGAMLRYVNPNQIHLTLEFLGELNEDQIEQVKEILSSITFQSFPLELKNLFVLPNDKYVRVISVDVKGDVDKLLKIQSELRTKLKAKGFKVDKRSYTPHLTIARVKSSKNKAELLEFIRRNKHFIFGKSCVTSVHLKESKLSPHGPIYGTLFKIESQEINQ
ncbi:MAG: RNA 2',3'-cyclic phosphodiesterase [Candidatus Heimdallarchaeaceae archaeon]